MLEEELLSVKQVADRLNVSVMSVYRLIDAARLTAVHIGRSVRITQKSFADYLNSLTNKETAPCQN